MRRAKADLVSRERVVDPEVKALELRVIAQR